MTDRTNEPDQADRELLSGLDAMLRRRAEAGASKPNAQPSLARVIADAGARRNTDPGVGRVPYLASVAAALVFLLAGGILLVRPSTDVPSPGTPIDGEGDAPPIGSDGSTTPTPIPTSGVTATTAPGCGNPEVTTPECDTSSLDTSSFDTGTTLGCAPPEPTNPACVGEDGDTPTTLDCNDVANPTMSLLCEEAGIAPDTPPVTGTQPDPDDCVAITTVPGCPGDTSPATGTVPPRPTVTGIECVTETTFPDCVPPTGGSGIRPPDTAGPTPTADTQP